MSKNSISILQEFISKSNKSFPVYDYVGHRNVGSNDHEFTIRVTYDGKTADGKGPTKKEAKINAAKGMLLKINAVKSTEIKINNNSCLASFEINKSPEKINTWTPLNTNSPTNYIGLLHEYCAQKRIPLPTFAETNSWGPSHMMNFTITCRIGDVAEEATATTKKQAKTEAAKKVWLKLAHTLSDSIINEGLEKKIIEAGIEIKDLKIEEIIPDYKKENNIAKMKYLQLTKVQVVSHITDRDCISNLHRLFVSDYSLLSRKSIIFALDEIIKQDGNILMLPKFKSILNKIATQLQVKLDRIDFSHRKTINYISYTVGFKLHTHPIVVSICSEDSSSFAELNSIVGISKDLKTLMS